MPFIEEAQSILSDREFDTLKDLSAKVAAFSSTTQEDRELADLKAKVHTAIQDRERVKGLHLLTTGAYTAEDVIKAAGFSKQDVLKAVSKLFPTEVTKPIATYLAGDYRDGERMTKELKEQIVSGGEAKFIESLTEFGRAYLKETRTSTKGPGAGAATYPNLAATAKRIGLKQDVMQALL